MGETTVVSEGETRSALTEPNLRGPCPKRTNTTDAVPYILRAPAKRVATKSAEREDSIVIVRQSYPQDTWQQASCPRIYHHYCPGDSRPFYQRDRQSRPGKNTTNRTVNRILAGMKGRPGQSGSCALLSSPLFSERGSRARCLL